MSLTEYFKEVYSFDEIDRFFFDSILFEAQEKKLPLVNYCRFSVEKNYTSMIESSKRICLQIRDSVLKPSELRKILVENNISNFSKENFKNALKILNEKGIIFSNDDLCYAFFCRD